MKQQSLITDLSAINKSIQSKRRKDLDTSNFPFSKLEISTYDVRINRQPNPILKKELQNAGQLQPITISVDTTSGKITVLNLEKGDLPGKVVNGKSRHGEMDELNQEFNNKFATVEVQVYENLTTFEQDLLNVRINISQKPLTADEKLAFVRRYKDELDPKTLGKAIGVEEKFLEHYYEVAEADDEVLEEFRPASDGHGRSDIKIEEYSKMSKAVKKTGATPSKELMIALGKQSAKSNLTRDMKRIKMPKLAEKSGELMMNESVVKKFSIEQIVEFADKGTSVNGSSGDVLPQNSSEKYKIINKLLKNSYDFAILLFAEGLHRTDSAGNSVESETKRIIDNIDDIILVGNEVEKLVEAQDYAIELGKNCLIHIDDVVDICEKELTDDDRCGFVYVNGASFHAQRPEFMNYLKKKYPNSTVAMVVLDLFFGKSQVRDSDRVRELITVYGGVKNFDELITKFKSSVKFAKPKKYAEKPQEKYIIYC